MPAPRIIARPKRPPYAVWMRFPGKPWLKVAGARDKEHGEQLVAKLKANAVLPCEIVVTDGQTPPA